MLPQAQATDQESLPLLLLGNALKEGGIHDSSTWDGRELAWRRVGLVQVWWAVAIGT